MAYVQLHDWLLGNTLTNSCTAKGTTWTCNFSGPNNYQAQAVWDTSETCKKGVCNTHQYAVNAEFLDYRTLDGSTIQITNGTVPIGAKQIWVEN